MNGIYDERTLGNYFDFVRYDTSVIKENIFF